MSEHPKYEFEDGDVITHLQSGTVNASYTRMGERWWRAPHIGGPASSSGDDTWESLLDQGVIDDCGYMYAGNIIHLSSAARNFKAIHPSP